MKILPAILAIAISAAMLCSCKESTSGPSSGSDTSSHAFTWGTYTLGDGNNSILYDVAIINDTLAYAVGAMYLKDSSGQWDWNAYNVARWNGVRWTLLRIPFIGACSALDYPPIMAVCALSNSSILVTNGGSIVRFDGVNAVLDCTINTLLTGAVTRLHAISPQDIYAVGKAGNIVHYDGAIWTKATSGTPEALRDVSGAGNGSDEWAVGYDDQTPSTVLLKGHSSTWTVAYDGTSSRGLARPDSLSGAFVTAWLPDNKHLLVGTDVGVYLANLSNPVVANRLWPETLPLTAFPRMLRGNSMNDWFFVCDDGVVVHCNGASFRQYPEIQNDLARTRSVAVKGNLAIVVGYRYDPINGLGLAMVGKR